MSSPASFPFYHSETFDFRENDLQSKICEIHGNVWNREKHFAKFRLHKQLVGVAAIGNGR